MVQLIRFHNKIQKYHDCFYLGREVQHLVRISLFGFVVYLCLMAVELTTDLWIDRNIFPILYIMVFGLGIATFVNSWYARGPPTSSTKLDLAKEMLLYVLTCEVSCLLHST